MAPTYQRPGLDKHPLSSAPPCFPWPFSAGAALQKDPGDADTSTSQGRMLLMIFMSLTCYLCRFSFFSASLHSTPTHYLTGDPTTHPDPDAIQASSHNKVRMEGVADKSETRLKIILIFQHQKADIMKGDSN